MKRLFILLIALIFILAGCAPTPALIEESPEAPDFSSPEPEESIVITPNTLTVGTFYSFSPFCWKDKNNELYGVDRIVMEKLAEGLGLELKIEKYDSLPSLFQNFEDNSVDIIITTLASTEERKEKYVMSTPYYYMTTSLYVRSEDYDTYISIISFKDKKIGVPGSEMHKETYADLLKPAQTAPYFSFWEAYDALLSKEIDGFVWYDYYAKYAEYDKEKVVPTKIELNKKAFPMVIYSNSRELMDKIDEIIAAGINNSTLEQYVDQYSKPITKP